MRLSTVISSSLVAGVLAQSGLWRRDVTAIRDLLTSVFESMNNVDNKLQEYKGGPPIALHQAGLGLYGVISEGIETLKNIEPLSSEDVASISDISQQVSTIGSKFLTDLAGAAPVFAENGICCQAREYSVQLGKPSLSYIYIYISSVKRDSWTLNPAGLTYKGICLV